MFFLIVVIYNIGCIQGSNATNVALFQ